MSTKNKILCVTAIIVATTAIVTTIQNYYQKSELNEFNKIVTSLLSEGSGISIVISPKEAVDIKEQETWTIQIVTFNDVMKNLSKATDMARLLKNVTGHNTFVARRADELVVCVGRFYSKDGDEIKKTIERISNLEYERKLLFTGIYPIQIR